MEHDLDDPEAAYYLLDGAGVRLDPRRGPLTPSGDRVDCVAWMDRAVSIGRAQYLSVAAAHAAAEPIGGTASPRL
jgi:hypothetical protein